MEQDDMDDYSVISRSNNPAIKPAANNQASGNRLSSTRDAGAKVQYDQHREQHREYHRLSSVIIRPRSGIDQTGLLVVRSEALLRYILRERSASENDGDDDGRAWREGASPVRDSALGRHISVPDPGHRSLRRTEPANNYLRGGWGVPKMVSISC